MVHQHIVTMFIGCVILLQVATMTPVLAQRTGYSLSMQASASTASTKKKYFDFSDPGFDALGAELTLCFWMHRFNLEPSESHNSISIIHPGDTNYIQPFLTAGAYIRTGSYTGWLENFAAAGFSADTWNHYCFVSDLSKNGESAFYVNGLLMDSFSVETSSSSTYQAEKMALMLSVQVYNMGETKPAEFRENSLGSASFDDIALFNRALNATEMRWWYENTPDTTVDMGATYPNLVLFYNFDLTCSSDAGMIANGLTDASCEYSSEMITKNHGLAGSDYDMVWGGIGQGGPFDDKYVTSTPSNTETVCGRTERTWNKPVLYSSQAKAKPLNPSTVPIVVHVTAGDTATIQLKQGASISRLPVEGSLYQADNTTVVNAADTVTDPSGVLYYRAPTNTFDAQHFVFSSTLGLPDSDTVPRTQQVHIWEAKFCTVADKSVVASEDSHVFVRLLRDAECGHGERMRARITTLPSNGKLYNTIIVGNAYEVGNEITTSNSIVSDTFGTVVFIPDTDETGIPYTSLKYDAFGVDTGIRSNEGTLTLSIQSLNDYPTAGVQDTTISEDSTMRVFDLAAADVENEAYTVAITKLPKYGKLYSLDDNNNIIHEITSQYEVFRVDETFGQWVDSVPLVSSYWGSAPSLDYHALMLVGSPTCPGLAGECGDQRPAADDGSLVGPLQVGDLVKYDRYGDQTVMVYAKLIESHLESTQLDTYNIQILPMQKEVNSAMVPCIMKGSTYPGDCEPVTDENVFNVENVPTTRLFTLGTYGGVWTPIKKAQMGSTRLNPAFSDAYGDGFKIDHVHDDYYLDPKSVPPFTEFVEVTFKEAVFPVAFEVHSPRGMGAVVHIEAMDPLGNWKTLYSGKPRVAEQAKLSAASKYSVWSPTMCRPSFKADKFRLELDTTAETGIGDWNYIDAMQLYGSRTMQSAVLQYPNQKVGYIPHPHQNGIDKFEYSVYDCGGDRFRKNQDQGLITVNISPVEDKPVIVENSKLVVQAARETDPLMFEIDLQDTDMTDVVTLYIVSCQLLPLDIVYSENPSTPSYEVCGVERDVSEYPISVGDFQLTGESTVSAKFSFLPAACSDPVVVNGTVVLELIDSEGLSSGLVTLVLSNDCTNMPWSPISTLPITIGVLAATLIAVVSVALSLRREGSITMAILDFIFSPMCVAILSMAFESADLITDIFNCLKFVFTEDKALRVYTSTYVSLTSIACLVSIWAMYLRARSLKTLIFLEKSVNLFFPDQRRLSLPRGSQEGSAKNMPVLREQSANDFAPDLKNAVDQTMVLLQHDFKYLLAKMDHIKVSATLLMCEDIPMIILNMVVIFNHKRMLTENVFLLSFILNLILITVKLVSVAEFRSVRLERGRTQEVLQEMADADASNKKKLETILNHGSRSSSIVAKKMYKVPSKKVVPKKH